MTDKGPFSNSKKPSYSHVAWKLWIADKIRTIREEKGCCISMLSLLSSLEEEYLHRVETAEIGPSSAALTKISMALGVPRSTFDTPQDFLAEE